MLNYQYSDGGRAAAGFKGTAGDCAVRACAIATGISYSEVYNTLQRMQKEYIKETQDKVAKTKSARVKLYYSKVVKDGQSVRNGTYVEVLHKFFESIGWVWTATMRIGSGCTKHLRDMPDKGVYVCRVAHHYVAVVNGVMMDTFQDDWDCCVYGYWHKPEVVLRRELTSRKWYITTNDSMGNIVAWVEGSKFVPLLSGVAIPKQFATREEAEAAMKTMGDSSRCVVRSAWVSTRWVD